MRLFVIWYRCRLSLKITHRDVIMKILFPAPLSNEKMEMVLFWVTIYIDESEGKVDICLNKQFIYPSLFFLYLHNSLFSPLFFPFFFFPAKILIFSQQNQHHQISIVLHPLPSSSSYPSYSSYFSSSCYPSSSSLLLPASIFSSSCSFFQGM